MRMYLWVTAQDCLGMSTLSCFGYLLHWGPTQTDWLSITSPNTIPLTPALLLPMPTATCLYTSCRCRTPVVANLLPKPEVALMQLTKGQNLFHSPLHPPGLCIAPTWPSTPPLLSLFYYCYLCYCYCWRTNFHSAAALLSGEHGILLLLTVKQGFFWPAQYTGEYKKQCGDRHVSPAGREQGRELEWRNTVLSPRGWQPCLLSWHPFSGVQKVSRNGTMPERLISDFCFLFC